MKYNLLPEWIETRQQLDIYLKQLEWEFLKRQVEKAQLPVKGKDESSNIR